MTARMDGRGARKAVLKKISKRSPKRTTGNRVALHKKRVKTKKKLIRAQRSEAKNVGRKSGNWQLDHVTNSKTRRLSRGRNRSASDSDDDSEYEALRKDTRDNTAARSETTSTEIQTHNGAQPANASQNHRQNGGAEEAGYALKLGLELDTAARRRREAAAKSALLRLQGAHAGATTPTLPAGTGDDTAKHRDIGFVSGLGALPETPKAAPVAARDTCSYSSTSDITPTEAPETPASWYDGAKDTIENNYYRQDQQQIYTGRPHEKF
ncbi:hypothetical protein FACS1894126_1110 [Alphaproteobacteria bacterium]|nr:hypothetical protein FACS1894126_1110 [Alphaproteobacteria bacterium]